MEKDSFREMYKNISDFENAMYGRVAQIESGKIENEDGGVICDITQYAFIPDDIDLEEVSNPEFYQKETVHESLWRQAILNKIHGLFKVCDGVYQVRGYDLANMTIIEARGGIIVVDCLTVTESAKAALDLYRGYKAGTKQKAETNVLAVILTHSHVDHYGGIGAITVENPAVKIIAPKDFLLESVLENAFVGDAMSRRSTYQYGTFLNAGMDGLVDCGLGKACQRGGSVTIAKPSHTVVSKQSFVENAVDIIPELTNYMIGGLNFEFMLTPSTEAPSEMVIYLKEKEMMIAAEITCHTLHNLLTPRGAQVRDARLWWKAIDQMLETYPNMEILCALHHWPIWGTRETTQFLKEQRDSYKFLHDQTVRLINRGYTMLEISEKFSEESFLPDFLQKKWHNRGYYGTISHNVRAIYQKYIGWYDMHPSNLNPLPPKEVAKRYVGAMGGYDAVFEIISGIMVGEKQEADLRWAAELGKHLVFSVSKENENQKIIASNLLAEVFQTLGLCQEAATWRNMYLSAAAELKVSGEIPANRMKSSANESILNVMDCEMLLDFLSCRINAGKYTEPLSFLLIIMDGTKTENSYQIEMKDKVLNYWKAENGSSTLDSLKISQEELVKIILKPDLLKTDSETIQKFFDLVEANIAGFEIVRVK